MYATHIMLDSHTRGPPFNPWWCDTTWLISLCVVVVIKYIHKYDSFHTFLMLCVMLHVIPTCISISDNFSCDPSNLCFVCILYYK